MDIFSQLPYFFGAAAGGFIVMACIGIQALVALFSSIPLAKRRHRENHAFDLKRARRRLHHEFSGERARHPAAVRNGKKAPEIQGKNSVCSGKAYVPGDQRDRG